MSDNNGSPAAAGRPHDRDASSPCRWTPSLSLDAMGSLSIEESRRLAQHLATSCPACQEERARVLECLAAMDALELADRGSLPTPSASVRTRLLRTIAEPAPPPPEFERLWQHLTTTPGRRSDSGLTTVSHGPQGWERTPIDGIEVKPLHVDAAQRRVSMLVKMAPGTSYPGHRHASSEECFVVSGEIQVGERTLRSGDYQVASQGSLHGVQSTKTGCVLFIVSSQDDELVAGC